MFKLTVQFFIAGLLTLPGLSAAAGPVKLPATSQTACFDENGNPRPCSGTGEDGEKQAGVAWPTERFSENNGTITDKLTGLVWSQHANAPSRARSGDQPNSCPNAETSMTWMQALDFVACLNAKNHAGFDDWRLPNLNELESMVNPGAADTSAYLNANGFGVPDLPNSQVQPGRYWSSTSDASGLASQSAIAAWDVDLVRGDFPLGALKNDPDWTRSVWPVRGKTSTPAQVWRTGQTLCLDEVGDSRPCAGTGEDGEMLAGAIWPSPRFKPNSNATFAVDKLTGLTWTIATQTPGPEACADTGYALTWQQALDHVACLNTNKYLGRSDWRLPNRKELRSLADYSTGAPALIAGQPFENLAGDTYWSSTTVLASTTDAWAVSMFDGSLSSAVKTEGFLPAWPVRGPDLDPPTLTIDQGNMTTKLASQTISGTVGTGATVQVTINNGVPVAATVNGTTWSFTTNKLTTGVNAITVTAADFSDNLTTASINITLDTAAPALSINPVAVRTNKKSHTFSGTVETGATIEVTTDGQSIPLTVTGNTWSFPVTELKMGANTIVVMATDPVGNVSPLAVTINFIPPDGIMSGGSNPGISDALKVLRIAVGIMQPSSDDLLHGDVAPIGAPDDKIDVSDVVLILRKAIGLSSF